MGSFKDLTPLPNTRTLRAFQKSLLYKATEEALETLTQPLSNLEAIFEGLKTSGVSGSSGSLLPSASEQREQVAPKSGHWRIYVCNKAVFGKRNDVLNPLHDYLRIVDPDGYIYLEIHGNQQIIDGEHRLSASIEPFDTEYYTFLEAGRERMVWYGDKAEAAAITLRAVMGADEINRREGRYNPFFNNCNNAVSYIMARAGLDVPDRVDGWAPGLRDISHKQPGIMTLPLSQDETEKWFDAFPHVLEKNINDLTRESQTMPNDPMPQRSDIATMTPINTLVI